MDYYSFINWPSLGDKMHLGVGLMQARLHNSIDILALDEHVQIVSDLLLVSIVPAISIEVDFELSPTFVATFSLARSGIESSRSTRLVCGRAFYDSQSNQAKSR